MLKGAAWPGLALQILFMDSLKLKGSLYGHKLPVLSMDISSDSTLLVTASADKNIKIWGLDFNDCHKSIFAHQDSVMQVSHWLKAPYLQHHVAKSSPGIMIRT